MGTRRENRPVSITGVNGLLTLDLRLPGARPAQPRARDPPSPCRRSYQRCSRAFDGHATATQRGRPPHMQGHKRREAMRQHRLSRTPDSQKLVPVTASYVTLKIHPLPTPRTRLSGRSGPLGQVGRPGPKPRAIRRASSTVNPSGDAHASPI